MGPGADPVFFLGGGALVSCSSSTPINHIVFFLQNTSCIRKPQVISGGGGDEHPLHPPPRSAPGGCVTTVEFMFDSARHRSASRHAWIELELNVQGSSQTNICLKVGFMKNSTTMNNRANFKLPH